MAKKSIINVTRTDDGNITFAVDGAGEFSINPATLSDAIREAALIHGIVQKISDGAAIPKADLPDDATEAAKAKFTAMSAIRDRLVDGEWRKARGDGSAPVAGIIFRAFSEWATGMAAKAKKPAPSPEKLRATYDAKSRAEQLALRNVPEIAAIIERMKAERGEGAAKGVDASALLGELGL